MKYEIELSRRALVGRFSYHGPEITLLVWTSMGGVPIRFVVDTGADLTAVPMQRARAERIDISPHAVQGHATGMHGQAVAKHRDWIIFQIADRRYRWPCDFVLVPPTAGPVHRSGRNQPDSVLGRAGFLQEFAVCIDDQYVKITCRNRSCPWWRRW